MSMFYSRGPTPEQRQAWREASTGEKWAVVGGAAWWFAKTFCAVLGAVVIVSFAIGVIGLAVAEACG